MNNTDKAFLALTLALCIKKKNSRRRSREWLKLRERYTHENLLREILRAENQMTTPTSCAWIIKLFKKYYHWYVLALKKKKDTVTRKSIPASQRLSMTLRYLASGADFEDLKCQSCVAPRTLSDDIIHWNSWGNKCKIKRYSSNTRARRTYRRDDEGLVRGEMYREPCVGHGDPVGRFPPRARIRSPRQTRRARRQIPRAGWYAARRSHMCSSETAARPLRPTTATLPDRNRIASRSSARETWNETVSSASVLLPAQHPVNRAAAGRNLNKNTVNNNGIMRARRQPHHCTLSLKRLFWI